MVLLPSASLSTKGIHPFLAISCHPCHFSHNPCLSIISTISKCLSDVRVMVIGNLPQCLEGAEAHARMRMCIVRPEEV